MTTQQRSKLTYEDYSELWNNTFQKVEEISQRIKRNVVSMEDIYANVGSYLDEIDRDTEILASFYSSINILDGQEYILKMRSLLSNEIQRYGKRKEYTETIRFLLEKLADMRQQDSETFPYLEHNESTKDKAQEKHDLCDMKDRHFRWISYRRYDSWYLCPFSEYALVYPDEKNPFINSDNNFSISHGPQQITGKDFLTPMARDEGPPATMLIIDNQYYLNADEIGKTIYAKTDFFKKKIKPFTKVKKCSFSPGRVRIFGRLQILLSGSSLE